MASSPRPLSISSPAKPFFNGNALSQLQPPQVRMLREGFEILDRDSDGVINREDVAEMLTQLGKNAPCPRKTFPTAS
jgi:Ca2+-binding EF-hand superfamily protein